MCQFEAGRALRLVLLGMLLLATARVVTAQAVNSPLPDAPVPASQSAPLPTLSQIDISWRRLPKRVWQDQKDIWLFPTQLIRGRYWAPTFAVVGGTAGLIVADPHVMPYFRSHAGKLDDVNDTFDGTITAPEIAIIPVSILASGYIRHDPYDVQTGLLAGEAFADGAILDLVMKAATRRNRPSDVPAGKPFNDTFFSGEKSPLSDSSFPSAHAIGAFSVATVIAHRYRQRRWAPWAAYGLAAAVSFSRVTTRAHFPSDVFLGAALGYTITRFEVLQH